LACADNGTLRDNAAVNAAAGRYGLRKLGATGRKGGMTCDLVFQA
jgi:hypothetical protein